MRKQLLTLVSMTSMAIVASAQETIRVTNLVPTSTMNSPTTSAPVSSVTTTTTTAVHQGQSPKPALQIQGEESASATSGGEYVKQPTTVVEAAPLTTSRAEELRKQREQSEIATEQSIVEKLEESRMEAEKKRQAAILGSISGGGAAAATQEANAAPAAPAQVQAAPVPVVVELKQPEAPIESQAAEPSATVDDVRMAVREELAASQKDVLPEPEHSQSNYFKGSVGFIDYDSTDIRTVGAASAAFGKVFDNQWALELSVLGANAYIDQTEFLYTKLQQFEVGLGTKFIILPGRVRPNVGLGVSYVNRSYSNLRNSWDGTSYANSDSGSWAIDYSIGAGLDVFLSENISVGIDYAYKTNLTYEFREEYRNTSAYRTAYGEVSPLEERDSSLMSLSFKYLF